MLSQWHKRAACRGQGPADFVRGPKSDYSAIRDLCETCPVRPECLEYALANESLTDEALTVGVGFALLAGFVEDLQVRPVDDGIGTEVRMVWPVAR